MHKIKPIFALNILICTIDSMHKQKQAYIDKLLKIVNSAVNVYSNLIGCFEVVPLAPALTVI